MIITIALVSAFGFFAVSASMHGNTGVPAYPGSPGPKAVKLLCVCSAKV